MDVLGNLINGCFLFLIFIGFFRIYADIFTSTVVSDGKKEMKDVFANNDTTGESQQLVEKIEVTVWDISPLDAEQANFGAATMIIARIGALACSAAIYYFFLKDLFTLS